MRAVRLILAIGLGPCLVAPAAAQSNSPAPDAVAQLIQQLGSGQHAQREAASRKLETLGGPALTALRDAGRSPDPEVRRRAEELLRKVEMRLESAQLLQGQRLRLSFENKPLTEAVADFNRRTGASWKVAENDRPLVEGRTVTLETGEVGYWQGLEQLCIQGGLSDRPAAADGTAACLVNAKAATLPASTSGAMRVRALAHHLPGWGQTPGVFEVPCVLEIQPEPGVRWRSLVDVRVQRAVDDQGQELEQVPGISEDETNESAGVANDLRWFKRGNLWQKDMESSGENGAVGQNVTVRLKLGKQPARKVQEMHGVLIGRMDTPPGPLVSVPDVLLSANQTFTGRDTSTLKIGSVSRDEHGVVKIEVEYQTPENDDTLSIGMPVNNRRFANQVLIWQIRAQGRTAASPNLELQDSDGRKFDIARYNESTQPIGLKSLYTATLHFQPTKENGPPARLVLIGRRTVMVEVPFTLKDVPLP